MLKLNVLASALLISIILSACESNDRKSESVAKTWAENTRKLGINPIYPPRERVYPGDIYITAVYDAATIESGPEYLYTTTPFRYHHLDLTDEFRAEAEDKRLMPAMASYTSGVNSEATWPMPSHNVGKGRLNGLIAFPGFTFASMTESKFGANITNGAWGGLFSWAQKKEYMVTYSVPAAEYISLELKPLLQKIRSYRAGITPEQMKDIRELGDALINTTAGDATTVIGVVIPSEVYYARSIEVTISSADGSAIQASAVTMAMVELSARKQKLQDQLMSVGEGGSSEKPKDESKGSAPPSASGKKEAGANDVEKPKSETKTPESSAESLRQQISLLQTEIAMLAKSAIPSAPGITGSATISSTSGVTLTQNFYYPIAVGYKGLTYHLESFATSLKPVTLKRRPPNNPVTPADTKKTDDPVSGPIILGPVILEDKKTQ